MAKKRLTGIVVSNAMAKTVVVQVERLREHPKYLRRIRLHKKYHAHDEQGEYQVGDKVVIEESKPQSRTKRWVVVAKA